MARKNATIATRTMAENAGLVFTVDGVEGEISISLDSLTNDIHREAMLHGLKQKISDAAALPAGSTNDDKFNAMLAVRDRLVEGDWNKRAGDGSGPVAGIIYLAFRRWVEEMANEKGAKVPTEEATRAVYDAKSRSDQLALRNVARIAEIIEEIKATRGSTSSTVDTDDLLGELGI